MGCIFFYNNGKIDRVGLRAVGQASVPAIFGNTGSPACATPEQITPNNSPSPSPFQAFRSLGWLNLAANSAGALMAGRQVKSRQRYATGASPGWL
jgi:hypothetical protein